MHEIENKQWLTLTSEEDWNPYDETFTENERKAREKKPYYGHKELSAC
jgi:hypothetical protein